MAQITELKRINPLYQEHPDVFWTLFDADQPSVDLILATYPSISREKAEKLFRQWEGTDAGTEQPAAKTNQENLK